MDQIEKAINMALDADPDADRRVKDYFDRKADKSRPANITTDQPKGWRSFDDVEKRTQHFLLPGIPDNNITLLVSDGGVGKGFLSCHLAAAISTGSATIFDEPETVRESGRVILINTEDSDECINRQRLEQAGANLSMIDTREENAPIPTIDDILARISETKPKLVIMDPLQSFIPKGMEMGKRNDMRKTITPLQIAAAEDNCAIVIIMHTNKTFGASGRKRLSDSSDLWDIARSVFILGETRDEERTKYISHEKSNYGVQLPTVLYRINEYGLCKVGETDKKDYDFISEQNKHAGGRPPVRREDAKDFIARVLQADPQGVSAKQLAFITEQNGIGKSTYERARREMVKANQIEVRQNGRGKDYNPIYLWNYDET